MKCTAALMLALAALVSAQSYTLSMPGGQGGYSTSGAPGAASPTGPAGESSTPDHHHHHHTGGEASSTGTAPVAPYPTTMHHHPSGSACPKVMHHPSGGKKHTHWGPCPTGASTGGIYPTATSSPIAQGAAADHGVPAMAALVGAIGVAMVL